MKTKLQLGEDCYDVIASAPAQSDAWRITINDTTHQAQLIKQDGDTLILRLDSGQILHTQTHWTRGSCELTLGTGTFQLREQRASQASQGGQHSGGIITAPLPGRIVDILVSEGESVDAGQAVCIIEAMKMQNEICSPVSGTVRAITAHKDSALESGDIILNIEPAA